MERQLTDLLRSYLLNEDGAVAALSHFLFESRGAKPDEIKHNNLQDRVFLALSVLPPETNRELAWEFAAHVLPIFEKRMPGEGGARRKLETYRAWATDQVDEMVMRRAVAWDCFTHGYSPQWHVLNAIGQVIDGSDWENAPDPWANGRYMGASVIAAREARTAVRKSDGEAAEAEEFQWQVKCILAFLKRNP